MKNDAVKSIIVLGSICLIVAVLLSSVNMLTEPIIKKAEAAKEDAAYIEVLPNATEFTDVELGDDVPASVKAMKKDEGGSGYAFKLLATATYSGTPMNVIVGIGADGKITKMSFVEYTDSPGIGTPEGFDELFRGKDNTTTDNDAGATVTTNALKAVLNDAYAVLGKYSTIEQSDEQKLVNIYGKIMPWASNSASGASKFEAVDLSAFDGVNPAVTAAFAPATKVGYVLLVKKGEDNLAVGVNAFGKAYAVYDLDGNEITDGVDEVKAAAESLPPVYLDKAKTAERRLKAAFKTAVSEEAANSLTAEVVRLENISSTVEAAFKVTAANKEYYAFFATAFGFHGNVQVLYVTDKEGNIVIYKTVSQSESAGYGDKIASEDYVAGITGNIDALSDDSVMVSGATVTSEAVKLAKNDIKAAFAAMKEGF